MLVQGGHGQHLRSLQIRRDLGMGQGAEQLYAAGEPEIDDLSMDSADVRWGCGQAAKHGEAPVIARQACERLQQGVQSLHCAHVAQE